MSDSAKYDEALVNLEAAIQVVADLQAEDAGTDKKIVLEYVVTYYGRSFDSNGRRYGYITPLDQVRHHTVGLASVLDDLLEPEYDEDQD